MLFVSTIITQIGRENKISADFYVSRTVEDAGPYNFVNILMRRNLIASFFLLQCDTVDALKLLLIKGSVFHHSDVFGYLRRV